MTSEDGQRTAAPTVTDPGPDGGTNPPELVTCPSCQQSSWIHTRRRLSTDFCPRCDFPLFWARGRVLRDEGDADGSSIRRLPGTAGVVTVVTRPCPECAEPNPLAAVTCLRCGALMDPPPPAPPAPAALPVLAPEPEPEPAPEPEPEPDQSWVVAVVLVFALCALLFGLVMVVINT